VQCPNPHGCKNPLSPFNSLSQPGANAVTVSTTQGILKPSANTHMKEKPSVNAAATSRLFNQAKEIKLSQRWEHIAPLTGM